MHRVASLIIVSAVATTSLQAQSATELRITALDKVVVHNHLIGGGYKSQRQSVPGCAARCDSGAKVYRSL